MQVTRLHDTNMGRSSSKRPILFAAIVLCSSYIAVQVMAQDDLAVTSPPIVEFVEVRAKRWQLHRVLCCLFTPILSLRMQNANRNCFPSFKQDTIANTDDNGAPLPEASTEAVAVTAGERQALLPGLYCSAFNASLNM
jgi:hypothetical protein